MLGATISALLWAATVLITAQGRLPGWGWLATVTILFWLVMFCLALPAAGLVLSLLFPILRRRTAAANGICLLAGATTGLILAPLASAKLHGGTIPQLCLFALIGATVSGLYLLLCGRLARDVRATAHPRAAQTA